MEFYFPSLNLFGSVDVERRIKAKCDERTSDTVGRKNAA